MANNYVTQSEVQFITALTWCDLAVGVVSAISFPLIILTGGSEYWAGYLALLWLAVPFYGLAVAIVLLYCLLNFSYVRYRRNAVWVRSVVKFAISFVVGVALFLFGVWLTALIDA
jgi:hypothetical protein